MSLLLEDWKVTCRRATGKVVVRGRRRAGWAQCELGKQRQPAGNWAAFRPDFSLQPSPVPSARPRPTHLCSAWRRSLVRTCPLQTVSRCKWLARTRDRAVVSLRWWAAAGASRAGNQPSPPKSTTTRCAGRSGSGLVLRAGPGLTSGATGAGVCARAASPLFRAAATSSSLASCGRAVLSLRMSTVGEGSPGLVCALKDLRLLSSICARKME